MLIDELHEYGNYVIDATEKAGYQKAVEKFVKDILSNKKQTLSVLADYSDYKIYKDGDTPPAGNSVAMQIGSNAEFNPLVEDLEGEAAEIIKDAIDLAMPSTFKAARKKEASVPEIKAAKADKESMQIAVNLTSGDKETIKRVVSDNNNLKNIEVIREGPEAKKGIWIYYNIPVKGERYKYIPWVYETDGVLDEAAIKNTARDVLATVSSKNTSADLGKQYENFIDKVDTPKSVVEFETKALDFANVDPDDTKAWREKVKSGWKNQSDERVIAQTDVPARIEEYFKEYLNMPGVEVESFAKTDKTFTIKIEGKSFVIPRRPQDASDAYEGEWKDLKGKTQKKIQEAINYYYELLSLEQPQGQPMDPTQIDATRYNTTA